jgi:hypothetical protein
MMAILLMIVTVSVAAGLAVVAIIEVPVAAAVIGSFLLEARARKRRRAGAPFR